MIDVEDVDLVRGDRTLLRHATWRLGPGDRVGIVGVNGAGKTSVLGLLDGSLPPDAGRVRHGRTVSLQHLTQDLDDLDPESRVLATLESIRRVTRTVEGGILMRTAEGTKLFGVTVNNRVAFEVDDYGANDGWSVVLKGTARALETEAEIAEAEASSLVPWIPTVKRNFIRIDVDEISGRRVTFGPEPEPDLDAS